MEIPHIPNQPRSFSSHTLPSIRVQHPHTSNVPFRPPHRSSSHSSSFQSFETGPMPIPNSREYVPPPLPPPRHIEDVEIAWEWGNTDSSAFGKSNIAANSHPQLGPIRDRSSWSSTSKAEFGRRGSSTSTIRGQSDHEGGLDGNQHPDEGYDSLKGSGFLNYTLKGEEPLINASQSSVDKAYDKSLVNRLGSLSDHAKRNTQTAPRNFWPSSLGNAGGERSPTSPSRTVQFGDKLKPLSLPEGMGQGTTGSRPHADMLARWNGVPDSAISPGFHSQGYFSTNLMDFRNPPGHKSSVSSLHESDLAFGRSSVARASASGSILSSHDDLSSLASRSTRGSYDQAMNGELESEFPTEEAGMKLLNLGDRDRTPPRSEAHSPGSKKGQKRRASSPPREQDARVALGSVPSASDLFHRRTAGHPPAQRTSPGHCFTGSVSSTSSAPRNGSLASSGGMSLAASSMTSASSLDPRLSPGGVSPSSELDPSHESSYVSSLNPSPRGSLSVAHQRTLSETKSASSVRKVSADGGGHSKRHSAPKLQGLHICECCPKKPKKFENMDDLRVHEMEKQYTCQYCHNRFKNKNEAERHQNSLHLRRHSWSCKQLSGVEAAFHASPHRQAAADVCGYCGEEFPLPANWDVRVEHLTGVHKFGECNQAKKFFRADHFRQHLKHSHVGTSGKWTNMLENACMKDEPVPERVGSVSDSVRGSVIDEVHDES
ncbi:MAG: hypothetical protein M1833_002871 [Piccolia ochrophora]|nr:MAG: hypothetical protein M1833_002871 [Piccolia ochrophora]